MAWFLLAPWVDTVSLCARKVLPCEVRGFRRSVAGVVSGLVVAIVLGGAGGAPASGASPAEEGRPGAAQAPGAAGFWFGGPSGFFRVHTSRLIAGTSSDLFTFLDEEFTPRPGGRSTRRGGGRGGHRDGSAGRAGVRRRRQPGGPPLRVS